MTTLNIDKEEYGLMIETLKLYKELLDHYEAREVAEVEKKSWKLKKLGSLADLI